MSAALRRCAATWLLAACSLAAADQARWESLHRRLVDLQQRHGVPALVLVVLDHGQPALIAADTPSAAARFDRDTPFRWGSISKTVSALILLESARRRGVSLDTPVATLLTDLPYRNPWSRQSPVRIDQLLELSAGLPDLDAAEFADNTPLPLAAALARGASQRVMLWPPGLQHSYSNAVPGISAVVIERLTGTSFDQAATDLVFTPLGMAPASYRRLAGLPGGFRADGTTPIPYWHVTFRAFGALNASPAAMAALLEALLNEGRVAGRQAVAAASIARMYRVASTLGARAGLEIGYGAGLYGWVRDGHWFHGHGGDADGYLSRFGLLPGAGRGYLLGIDVDDPELLGRMRRIVERALIEDLAPLPEPPVARLGPDVLAGYSGEYYPASTRFGVVDWRAGGSARARLVVEDGGLVFLRSGRRQPLLAVAPGRFRRPGDPAVSVVLVERDGALFLQGELGNWARTTPPCADFVPACNAASSTNGASNR